MSFTMTPLSFAGDERGEVMTTNANPFEVPMIFLRIGWMERYQGFVRGDAITGGGSFVHDMGYGHEILNFAAFQGRVYGYVQPPGGGHNLAGRAKIHVDRIGGGRHDTATGVIAVWVATKPDVGAFVVGWYRNAAVHSDWQAPPAGSQREHDGQGIGYYVEADSHDAVLLPPDERVFPIPQHAKGAMGQSNIWYADAPDFHRDFRERVLEYIETRSIPKVVMEEDSGTSRQPDPLLRLRVEEAAVQVVFDHYTKLGYRVDSVEKDNVGWDLNAVLGKRNLKLEVKGLSATEPSSELTPNEYTMMRKHTDSYRLCVVTNALNGPNLEIFAYSDEARRWESQFGRRLDFEEIVSARFSSK